MSQRILFDSPAIESVMKMGNLYHTPGTGSSHRETNLDNETEPFFYYSADEYYFHVTDASKYNEDGSVKELKIKVINGIIPDSAYCGTINNRDYPVKEIMLSGTGTRYIYAVDGEIYALNHRFQSNVVPAVLLAEVELKEQSLSVQQVLKTTKAIELELKNYARGVSIVPEIEYSNETLSISYSANISMVFNGLYVYNTVELSGEGYGQSIVFAIKKLFVKGSDAPEAEVLQSTTSKLPEGYEYVENLIVYNRTVTGDNIGIYIESIFDTNWRWTYSYASDIFCAAQETGEN